jgi:putative tryptophan/tyrosine transport system substrate-binding protein
MITLLGGAAMLPVAARAQAMPVIGFLDGGAANSSADRLRAFHQGLGAIGYVEGNNVLIEYRWAEGRNERLPALAADLVRRRVEVIAGMNTTASVQAAKAATSTIPIVFAVGADPVKTGLVASLSRPEGNVTGVTAFTNLVVAKRIELLRELVPKAEAIGILVNPANPNTQSDVEGAETAVHALGLKLSVANASSESAFESAFAKFAQQRIAALLVAPDPSFTIRREKIVALAVRHTIATSYATSEFVTAGGLMSHGTDRAETYRQVGLYTGRILKGAKPADLPVMQPTKFEFVINLQTARALGIDVPPSLLAIADEVIE